MLNSPPMPSEIISLLERHSIHDYKQRNKEIAFACPFGGCDDDRRRSEELHCSINIETGLYNCFKCGAKGNYITLLKHFNEYEKPEYKPRRPQNKSQYAIAKDCHSQMSDEDRQYYRNRGLSDETIDTNLLGIGEFYGERWRTVPVFSNPSEVLYIKLRRIDDSKQGEKYKVSPLGSKVSLAGLYELTQATTNSVLICEGELDRLLALQNGVDIPIITCGGANLFKEEWIEDHLQGVRNVYLCFDLDDAGKKATERVAEMLERLLPHASVFSIELPSELDEHGDLSDYFNEGVGTSEELLSVYTRHIGGIKPIDMTTQHEMTVDDVASVLDLTIKHDYHNKVIVFLAMLSAYTEEDQLNISLNAPSSSGKSHIVKEVARLFPSNDVKMYGKASPTSFYYNEDAQSVDSSGRKFINLERKIMVFLDQVNTQLQENLRTLLSHDEKEIPFLTTNKNKTGTNTAKESYLRGFPATFFCSASMRMDEQEQTRFLLLSPETTAEKIEAGISAALRKQSDRSKYEAELDNNQARQQLIDRILYIKQLGVNHIVLPDIEYVHKLFMQSIKKVKARSQRDIQHFNSLIKTVALLNAPFRENENGDIVATKPDVDQAYTLWARLSESQLYGITPQVLDVYREYILPAYTEKNEAEADEEYWQGVSLKDLFQFYYRKENAVINSDMYRKNYIPMLEASGLISLTKHPNDKRQAVIIPQVFFDQ